MIYTTLILSSESPPEVEVLAFPGAEGVGTKTGGGRGGTVLHVTNLNDTGAGSLRIAVESNFPRIIIFDVTGIINLQSDLEMFNPFCTISGQTSPGGIIVAGRSTEIRTHDVICRYVRFRTGIQSTTPAERETLRSLAVDGNNFGDAGNADAYNVVVDHCSLSWSADQCLNAQNDAYDVTFSWNFIAEPLTDEAPESNHGYSMFFWGKHTDESRQYTAHHNFSAHSQGRNPLINFYGKLDNVNNVTYNLSRGFAAQIEANETISILSNLVGNFNKYGPSTSSANLDKSYINMRDVFTGGDMDESIWVQGNIGPHRPVDTDPEINSVSHTTFSPSFMYTHPASTDYLALTPFVFNETVTSTTMDATYAQVIVDTVGATFPVRDDVDVRVAADFLNGTGALKGTSSYPSDWPDLVTGAPGVDPDTNSDGIPDGYETFKGFTIGTMNPHDPAPSRYPWIEEYWEDLVNGDYVP